MVGYLVGISQNLVAEILIVLFSVWVWRRLRGRWEATPPMAFAEWRAVAERAFARALAIAAFAAAVGVSSIEGALRAVAIAAFFTAIFAMGAAYVGALLRLAFATSWLSALRVAYWVCLVAFAAAWLAAPHVLWDDTIPREQAFAFNLVTTGLGLFGVQAVPAWIAAYFESRADDESVPAQELLVVSTIVFGFVALLARRAYTWQEALAIGPTLGALAMMATTFAFAMVILAARPIAAAADRRGWIPDADGTSSDTPDA